ncbi:MAG: acylphosphatase [Bacteroidales bacterium]|nr:acylphosphatase [Bacteroidales bacterium]MBN2758299.1 acylphosphatase [Bacteroidales bacterium]
MTRSVILNVIGKVQGVGFRFYTLNAALQNNIVGFVKNQKDGSVYIEAKGESVDIEVFIDWCKFGPQWAKVDFVSVVDANINNYTNFEIR